MHGFINSPALAKLVALQSVDEEIARHQRRRRKAKRTPLRAFRWLRRSSSRTVSKPAGAEPSVVSRQAQSTFLNHRTDPVMEKSH
jgi:hypothetical protein